MNHVTRYEFLGSPLLFALLALTGIGIPFAVLCLVNSTVAIEHELDDPEAFVKAYRGGKLG